MILFPKSEATTLPILDRSVCISAKKLTDASLVKIGEVIGKRDHSTVIHGVEKIEKDLKKDSNLQNIIDVITKKME